MNRTGRISTYCGGLLAMLVGCEPAQPDAEHADIAAALRSVPIPAQQVAGEAAYEGKCAVCHGELALGTTQGPPLVHVIYEPSHHADIAFHLAVERGVRAHHWRFGDMPPVPDIAREEVDEIVGYIRFLQRQVGIG